MSAEMPVYDGVPLDEILARGSEYAFWCRLCRCLTASATAPVTECALCRTSRPDYRKRIKELHREFARLAPHVCIPNNLDTGDLLLIASALANGFNAQPLDGRSQAAPADLRALKKGDRITVDATFGEYGYESDGIVHRNDVALIDVPQFGATKARTIHPVPVASLHPAAPPAQPASQVTLNCARCVQNGETAANVAGATCGRCGNATPATSPPTPAASSGLAAEPNAVWERIRLALWRYDKRRGSPICACTANDGDACKHHVELAGLAYRASLSEGQQRP